MIGHGQNLHSLVSVVENDKGAMERRTSLLDDVIDQGNDHFRYIKGSSASYQSFSSRTDDGSKVSRAYTIGGMEQKPTVGPNLHLASKEDLLAELERRRPNLQMASEADLITEIERRVWGEAPEVTPKSQKAKVKKIQTQTPPRSPIRKSKSKRNVQTGDRQQESEYKWNPLFTQPDFCKAGVSHDVVGPTSPSRRKLKVSAESPYNSPRIAPVSPKKKTCASPKSPAKKRAAQLTDSPTASASGRMKSQASPAVRSALESRQSPKKLVKKPVAISTNSSRRLKKASSSRQCLAPDVTDSPRKPKKAPSRRRLVDAPTNSPIKSPMCTPKVSSHFARDIHVQPLCRESPRRESVSDSVQTVKTGNPSPLERAKSFRRAKSLRDVANKSPKKLEPCMLVSPKKNVKFIDQVDENCVSSQYMVKLYPHEEKESVPPSSKPIRPNFFNQGNESFFNDSFGCTDFPKLDPLDIISSHTPETATTEETCPSSDDDHSPAGKRPDPPNGGLKRVKSAPDMNGKIGRNLNGGLKRTGSSPDMTNKRSGSRVFGRRLARAGSVPNMKKGRRLLLVDDEDPNDHHHLSSNDKPSIFRRLLGANPKDSPPRSTSSLKGGRLNLIRVQSSRKVLV